MGEFVGGFGKENVKNLENGRIQQQLEWECRLGKCWVKELEKGFSPYKNHAVLCISGVCSDTNIREQLVKNTWFQNQKSGSARSCGKVRLESFKNLVSP